jgi:hypothetical protein
MRGGAFYDIRSYFIRLAQRSQMTHHGATGTTCRGLEPLTSTVSVANEDRALPHSCIICAEDKLVGLAGMLRMRGKMHRYTSRDRGNRGLHGNCTNVRVAGKSYPNFCRGVGTRGTLRSCHLTNIGMAVSRIYQVCTMRRNRQVSLDFTVQ